jgi:hypothetical protein
MNDCVDALTETVQHRMSECLGRRLQRSDAHDAIAGDISTDDAAIVFGPGRREATRLRPADDEFARSGSTNADVAEAYVELGIVPESCYGLRMSAACWKPWLESAPRLVRKCGPLYALIRFARDSPPYREAAHPADQSLTFR